jgi:uncharacterized cupin superfamily protein
VPEARLEQTGSGLRPASEGWFVLNIADAVWLSHDEFGFGARLEGPEAPFEQLGLNIRVLEPGQPNCLYHRESLQEDFLVLAGECKLLVDEEERTLSAWDFFHCPPGVDHVFVGAGDGPCVILMVGARGEDEELFYPVSELAQRYGASSEEGTPDPAQAYARFSAREPGPPPPGPWS